MKRFLFILALMAPIQAFGQTFQLAPIARQQFFTNTGLIAAGYKLCTFLAGSTTPQAAFSDNIGTALPNPITLNAAGRPQTAGGTETGLYLNTSTYKFILYASGTGNTCNGTAVGTLIWSQDNISFNALLGTGAVLDCSTFYSTTNNSYSKALNACASALGTNGGTADARRLNSLSTAWNTDAFNGITAPVDYLCAPPVIVVATTSSTPTNVHTIRDQGCQLSINSGLTFTVNGPMDGSSTDGTAFLIGTGTGAMGSPYYIFNDPLLPKAFQTTNLGWLGIGTNGGTVNAPISAINNVNVGDSNAAHFDSTAGCPYIDVGSIANNGGLMYFRGQNAPCGNLAPPRLEFGLHNSPVTLMMTTSGLGVMTTASPPDPLDVVGKTVIMGAASNTSVVNIVPSSGGFSVIDCDKIGTGSPLPCQLQMGGVAVFTATSNGGNGQFLVNTTSTDFTSCISCSFGTFAVITGATTGSTNSTVLALNASGGDGNSQIVFTHSAAGTTKPLEIFADSTKIMTFKTAGTVAMNSTMDTYNNVATVSEGLPYQVATADQTTQAANINATTVYAVPASGAGRYRSSCYVVVTQAATNSSTMPNCNVIWTDSDTNSAAGTAVITSASTANLVATNSTVCQATCTNTIPLPGSLILNVHASSNIQYSTSGYASNGGTPMQYAVHFRLERLGN